MKLRQFLLIILLILLGLPFIFGQETSNAKLIDAVREINNDNLLTRIDNLKMLLSDTDKSYIVINSEEIDQFYKYKMERRILKCSGLSSQLKNKVFVLFDNSKNENLTEFWQVPDGATIPRTSDNPQNFVLSKNQKETLIHSTSFENEYCHLHFDLEFYSKLLSANPNLIGKIKIFAKNRKQALNTVFKLSQTLIKKFFIPKVQLKISYTLANNLNYQDYWLVPKKKSH